MHSLSFYDHSNSYNLQTDCCICHTCSTASDWYILSLRCVLPDNLTLYTSYHTICRRRDGHCKLDGSLNGSEYWFIILWILYYMFYITNIWKPHQSFYWLWFVKCILVSLHELILNSHHLIHQYILLCWNLEIYDIFTRHICLNSYLL